MMISEFIEMTKFEPTMAEYQEIENEYMGCDIDKQAFCRQWLKNGGVQRLSRIRARKIEELENKLKTLENYSDKMQLELTVKANQANQMVETLKAENERLKNEKNMAVYKLQRIENILNN